MSKIDSFEMAKQMERTVWTRLELNGYSKVFTPEMREMAKKGYLQVCQDLDDLGYNFYKKD